LAGTAGALARKRAKGARSFRRKVSIHFRASRLFAGGAPAVPADLF